MMTIEQAIVAVVDFLEYKRSLSRESTAEIIELLRTLQAERQQAGKQIESLEQNVRTWQQRAQSIAVAHRKAAAPQEATAAAKTLAHYASDKTWIPDVTASAPPPVSEGPRYEVRRYGDGIGWFILCPDGKQITFYAAEQLAREVAEWLNQREKQP